MTVELGPVSAFPASGRLLVQADKPVAVFKVGENFFGIEELCPHRGGPLSEGKVENGCVTCPWHNATFEIATGRVLTGPVNRNLKTYTVTESGGLLTLHA